MCVSMRVVYCWLVPTLSHTCYQRAKWYVDMSVAGWGMIAADYTAGSPRAAVASHIGGNCAGDQAKEELGTLENLVCAKIPTVSVALRSAPLGVRHLGKKKKAANAQHPRFGGGLRHNMSADTSMDSLCDEPASADQQGKRGGKLDLDFLLKNFHLPLPPPSRGNEGPVDYLSVVHAPSFGTPADETAAPSLQYALSSRVLGQDDTGIPDAAQTLVVDLRQASHAGDVAPLVPRPAAKSRSAQSLAGSRAGLSPRASGHGKGMDGANMRPLALDPSDQVCISGAELNTVSHAIFRLGGATAYDALHLQLSLRNCLFPEGLRPYPS